jgi:hypothetical protein
MARQFVLACLALFALVGIGLACDAPVNTAPGSPAAQGTDVRRTQVTRAQNVISNPSTATPVPAATATPTPTCPDAIWWTEARAHLGETRTVQGTVVGTRLGPSGGQLVEVGLPYPDPLGLGVVLGSGDASALAGKGVCVTGKIGLVEGRTTLQLQDATGFKLVD